MSLIAVVYMCQKSLNFIDALSCYKQKWKLAPFNFAHPVDHAARALAQHNNTSYVDVSDESIHKKEALRCIGMESWNI